LSSRASSAACTPRPAPPSSGRPPLSRPNPLADVTNKRYNGNSCRVIKKNSSDSREATPRAPSSSSQSTLPQYPGGSESGQCVLPEETHPVQQQQLLELHDAFSATLEHTELLRQLETEATSSTVSSSHEE
jgi:hypothetical protein